MWARSIQVKSAIFVPDNIEPRDPPLDVGQSSKSPHRIPDIQVSETEGSIWNELSYRKEQAQPTLSPMLPAPSVMENLQNVPWSKHPAPSQTDQTPSYSESGFQRTDYDFRL